MKTVLVLGGSGFIGSNIINALIKSNYSVIFTCFKNNSSLSQNLNCIQLDLSSSEEIRKKLPTDFDYVINCSGYIDHASFLHGGNSIFDAHFTNIVNVINHINLSKIKRFINIGSSDEYGEVSVAATESFPTQPFSPYSLAKSFLTEYMMFLATHHNFPFTSYRLFLVYGPGQKIDRLIPLVIKSCLNDEDFDVSPGEQIRDLSLVTDIAKTIVDNIDNKNTDGEIINLGSGSPVSIREVIQTIQHIIGMGNPIFGGKPYRDGESMLLVPCLKKASEILRIDKFLSLRKGLELTIKFYASIK